MWGEPKDRERDVCDEGVTAEGSDALGLGAGRRGLALRLERSDRVVPAPRLEPHAGGWALRSVLISIILFTPHDSPLGSWLFSSRLQTRKSSGAQRGRDELRFEPVEQPGQCAMSCNSL